MTLGCLHLGRLKVSVRPFMNVTLYTVCTSFLHNLFCADRTIQKYYTMIFFQDCCILLELSFKLIFSTTISSEYFTYIQEHVNNTDYCSKNKTKSLLIRILSILIRTGDEVLLCRSTVVPWCIFCRFPSI